jgi:hypothetical protein
MEIRIPDRTSDFSRSAIDLYPDIWYESCCFPDPETEVKVLRMTDSKCWNCGEDCFEATSPGDDSAVVQVHYVIEKKQVCGDCYQILRELDDLD